MKVGFVGMKGSGRTTLLHAVSGSSGSEFEREMVRTVPVADPRMERLREMYSPKKFTLARITILDSRGLLGGGEKGDAEALGGIREMDAVAVVLRAFRDGASPAPPDPGGQLDHVLTAFQLADLDLVETRIQKLEKAVQKPSKTAERDRKELELLLRAQAVLSGGGRLESLEVRSGEDELIRGYRFLTQKPVLAVLNLDDSGTDGDVYLAALRPKIPNVIAIRGRLEKDLQGLDEAERGAFMADFGVTESAATTLVRALYDLVGLCSFFTVGEDEVRAWTIRRGDNAVTSAGKVHTDIARGFIRAEVIACDDLLAAGDMRTAKARNLLRLEGKDYVVQDGDIINFRHGG